MQNCYNKFLLHYKEDTQQKYVTFYHVLDRKQADTFQESYDISNNLPLTMQKLNIKLCDLNI